MGGLDARGQGLGFGGQELVLDIVRIGRRQFGSALSGLVDERPGLGRPAGLEAVVAEVDQGGGQGKLVLEPVRIGGHQVAGDRDRLEVMRSSGRPVAGG